MITHHYAYVHNGLSWLPHIISA